MIRVPRPTANFTPMPNIFFDEVLRSIPNMAALKCYLVLIRKTWGWDKAADWLTTSQFQELTGLSKPSVIAGLNWLKENDYIWCVRLGGNGKEQIVYFLYSEETSNIETAIKNSEIDEDTFRKLFAVPYLR